MSVTKFLSDITDNIKNSESIRVVSIDPALQNFAYMSVIINTDALISNTTIGDIIDSEDFIIENGEVLDLSHTVILDVKRDMGLYKKLLLLLNDIILKGFKEKACFTIFLVETQPSKNKITETIEMVLLSMMTAIGKCSHGMPIYATSIDASNKNDFVLYQYMAEEDSLKKTYARNKRRSVKYFTEYNKKRNKILPKGFKLDDISDCFLFCTYMIDKIRSYYIE